MLKILLMLAIVGCVSEDPEDKYRYLIDVEGLVDGEHVQLGASLTDLSIKVTEFAVSRSDGERSIKDEGVVTSGSLAIEIDCHDNQLFSKNLDIASETTKIPQIDLVRDKFERGSCKLIVEFAGTDSRGDRQQIGFSIIEEGYCADSESLTTEYIIGKGFEKSCANQTYKLTQQCGEALQLFYYYKTTDVSNLSVKPLDNDYVVIVMTDVADNWSIPKGCVLKINNRDVALTKPSSGQNLAESLGITSVTSSNRVMDFDNYDKLFYLTVGNGWYKHSGSSAGVVYPDDLGQLAIMTHKKGWWSYLAGPKIRSIDDRPLRAGQPIVVGESAPLPPEGCSVYLYNDGTLVDYRDQPIVDGSYLFTTSACTFKATKLGVTFDVPVANAEFMFRPLDEDNIFSWVWADLGFWVTLPTKEKISEVMGNGVADNIWLYHRVNTRGDDQITYGEWQSSESVWGNEFGQRVNDAGSIAVCDNTGTPETKARCWVSLSAVFEIMVKVERNNQSYWLKFF